MQTLFNRKRFIETNRAFMSESNWGMLEDCLTIAFLARKDNTVVTSRSAFLRVLMQEGMRYPEEVIKEAAAQIESAVRDAKYAIASKKQQEERDSE